MTALRNQTIKTIENNIKTINQLFERYKELVNKIGEPKQLTYDELVIGNDYYFDWTSFDYPITIINKKNIGTDPKKVIENVWANYILYYKYPDTDKILDIEIKHKSSYPIFKTRDELELHIITRYFEFLEYKLEDNFMINRILSHLRGEEV
jgi:hypothetical protein